MLQVLGLVFPLFALIFLGYVTARFHKIPIEGLSWLNVFVVYVALPALFFQLLSETPLDEFANGWFVIATTAGTFAIFLLCFVVAMLRRGGVPSATIQGFTGAYGNIGYLGPPLALAAFGPEAVVPVALIFCLDNAMHFTLAPLLMAVGDRNKKGSNTPWGTLLLGIARRIMTHPFILATLVGIAAAAVHFEPAEPIDRLLTLLANAAAPCALFAMGVTAALRPLKRIPVELSYLIPIKLLLHPLLMLVLVGLVPGVPQVWLYTAVLMAALPTATNVFVLAQQYQTWEQRASSAVVLSTVIATVTVTAYLYLVRG